jgi:hypothetical protein
MNGFRIEVKFCFALPPSAQRLREESIFILLAQDTPVYKGASRPR